MEKKIRVGFFAGGEERVEVQHWSRCKPAFVREGQAEAERSKLGRPAKTRPPGSEADSKLTLPVIQNNSAGEKEEESVNKQNSNRRGKTEAEADDKNSNRRGTRNRAPPDRFGF